MPVIANTGDFNRGNRNTGYFNTGDTNTGFANTGNVNTGAFNSGNFNNGLLLRGDQQGQFQLNLGLTIEEILVNAEAPVFVNIPVGVTSTPVTIDPITIPEIDVDGGINGLNLDIPLIPFPSATVDGDIGAIDIGAISIGFADPFLSFNIGDPDVPVLPAAIGAGIGPIRIPLEIFSGAGFGNTGGTQSSGFFNTGGEASSGFFNSGGDNSGFFNVAQGLFGNSGLNNVGGLQSGIANLGNSISGWLNTAALRDLFGQGAQVSGISNAGSGLAGLFRDGSAGTIFNVNLDSTTPISFGSLSNGIPFGISSTIPAFGFFFDADLPLNLPIDGTLGAIDLAPFSIGEFGVDLDGRVAIPNPLDPFGIIPGIPDEITITFGLFDEDFGPLDVPEMIINPEMPLDIPGVEEDFNFDQTGQLGPFALFEVDPVGWTGRGGS